MEKYKRIDALDKIYKPLIIKWLCKSFGYKNYPHSFTDQFIHWSLFDGKLTINFDFRVPEQIRLIKSIPKRFRGIKVKVGRKVFCFGYIE